MRPRLLKSCACALRQRNARWRSLTRLWTAGLLLTVFPVTIVAQAANGLPLAAQSPPAQSPASETAASAAQSAPPVQNAPAAVTTPPAQASQAHLPTASEKRRAAKLFLASSKLFVNGQFEAALQGYAQAAEIDPSNADYRMAAEVARSHAVTAMIQSAAKSRLLGDDASARAALAHALELDPSNAQATQHLFELGNDAMRPQPQTVSQQSSNGIADVVEISPSAGVHSFHAHGDQIPIIRQVFTAYGLIVMFDDSVHNLPIRLDIDDASFPVAMSVLGLVTSTFYIPLDPHRVLVARDNRENRQQFTRQELETVYIPGLSEADLADVNNVAKNVFDAQKTSTDAASGTITLRAPRATLTAFNSTIRTLLDGRNQVLLDVRMIQIAHTSTRNTGVSPPQTISAFNVYAEEQSILNANQSLVQQIISSGLAGPGDTLVILGILLASGQVSSSLFSNGLALFGGGLTESGLSPPPATFNLNLNTSDSSELDQIQLRLGDGEAGTFKEGERYPIQTSSFSGLSGSIPKIPGLTGAGSSSSLSSLVSSLTSSVPTIPMVQYQDLGLTFKATPKVMRSGNVALTIDMKLDTLSGTSINGNPILNSQAFSGVSTLKEGEAAVVAAELNKSQSMNISGTPGISEIPGLNNTADKNMQTNYATLLIIITPHVVRGTQAAGHTPMMMVSKTPAQQ